MAKGFLEEGFNVLLAIIVFVIVVGLIFLFVLSGANKLEEQTFLDSVTELQYAMEYVCTTGQTQYVDVRFPQQISNAQAWISGYGDPKYMVYFERFPVGEEWSWETLRFSNPTIVSTESLLIGVGLAVATSGLGSVGSMETTMGKGGYLSRLFSSADDMVEASYSLDSTIQKVAAKNGDDIIVAEFELSEKRATSTFGFMENPFQSIKNYFIKGNKIPLDTAKAINVNHAVLLDACEQKLGNIQKSITAGSQVSDELKTLLKFDGAFKDVDTAETVIEYIEKNSGKFGDAEWNVKLYEDALKNNRRFMMGELTDSELLPHSFTNDDLKSYYSLYTTYAKSVKYVQYPRNVILPAVAGKGTWAVNTYIFDNMLSPLDRANQKFTTCGAKSLCAKTQNYIAVYPLQKCEASGIEYVRVHISKTVDTSKFGWVDLLPTSWSRYITNEDKRFYIASPCGERYKIEKGTCKCHSTQEPTYKLTYTEDASTGEWGFDFSTKGFMRICDEGTDSDSSKTTVAIGDIIEDVPCLIVTPTGESLEGYGSGKDYNNFCNSLPESYYKAADNGLVGLSTLVDIGAYVGGYTSWLVPVANTIVLNYGNAEQAKAFLWSSGGLG